MSCPRTDALYRRLLLGSELTPDERRHTAGCPACMRVAADAERLDARLRDAAGRLAIEPMPDDLLDAEPMAPRWTERLPPAPGAAVAAAVVVAIAVAVMLVPTQAPVAVETSPSPTSTGTPQAQPSPTPQPTAAVPTPKLPPLDAMPVDPLLVGPDSTCADGVIGFSILLPEGWYANRRAGDQPACAGIGHVRVVEGRLIVDPEVYFAAVAARPTYERIESSERIELASGVTVDRYVASSTEEAALAAERSVVYVAPLAGSDDLYLVASTDAESAEAVAGLDAMIARLEVFEPLTIDPAAMAAARELFEDLDACVGAPDNLVVTFPETWWTNTAVDGVEPCTFYAPSSFEIDDVETVPAGVAISISVADGGYGTFAEILGSESLVVAHRQATRWEVAGGLGEVADADRRAYQYIVLLGDVPEFGPNLVATAHAAVGDDYELAKAVLDQMMLRIGFASAPPGASSEEPPISAPPVSATAREGDFSLELSVEQDRYRAGQPIFASATLTYTGPEPSVRAWGSGSGILGMGLVQLDGPISPWGGATSDCRRYELTPGEPMRVPFTKSGGLQQRRSTGSLLHGVLR